MPQKIVVLEPTKKLESQQELTRKKFGDKLVVDKVWKPNILLEVGSSDDAMHNPTRVSMLTSKEGSLDNSAPSISMQTMHAKLAPVQHNRFFNKKKKVINEDEVLNSLSDLGKVSRFPHSCKKLMGILKTFLKSMKDKRGESNIEVVSSSSGLSEPNIFDDDELIIYQDEIREDSSSFNDLIPHNSAGAIYLKVYPENFGVDQCESPTVSQQSRVSVDLVTVLDVSGNMTGRKLALVKRVMGFVIQNMGPSDRLSVVAFSFTSRHLFPLCKMTNAGKQEALQAINSQSSNSGTNIEEGLEKDTYTIISLGAINGQADYQPLLPVCMHHGSDIGTHIPIHAFGFGADHDVVSMHSIAETFGGTISFVKNMIEDAFAQFGDLYADEERIFLITTDILVDKSSKEVSLVKIKYVYKDPVSKELVTLNHASEVKIPRPETSKQPPVSIEVDKQQNRLRSTRQRAYVLPGLSSHLWQRATAPGDSTDSTRLVQAYQTLSMVDLVKRSQTMIIGSPSPRPSLRPVQSFPT
ncbi:hypothetical protein ACH5RR_032726 [Cinchona calisaya]|uniref:VWFA domain-containing protein n=1 Tax=Cinchona calisaya TaxID=153742 RepID=A0ABD2YIW4_9GENT